MMIIFKRGSTFPGTYRCPVSAGLICHSFVSQLQSFFARTKGGLFCFKLLNLSQCVLLSPLMTAFPQTDLQPKEILLL